MSLLCLDGYSLGKFHIPAVCIFFTPRCYANHGTIAVGPCLTSVGNVTPGGLEKLELWGYQTEKSTYFKTTFLG